VTIYTHNLNENLSAIFNIEPNYVQELSDQELTARPDDLQLVTGGGYISKKAYESMRERWKTGEIKHTDEFCERASENMKKNNPMFDPKVVAKVVAKMTGRPGRKLSEDEKLAISKRMKENNPTKNNPACTNTARPITVYYTDGTVEDYSYAKELTKVKGIPYSTIKLMIRDSRGSEKHKIKEIIQDCQG
jgi:hypothetical protein